MQQSLDRCQRIDQGSEKTKVGSEDQRVLPTGVGREGEAKGNYVKKSIGLELGMFHTNLRR